MKFSLQTVVEAAACKLAAVDTYADIFEQIARTRWRPDRLKRRITRYVQRMLDKSPAIFIHVPKNAGTSINAALYGFNPGHRSARLYDAFAQETFAAAESFAVLRNPIDRFLSSFDFLMAGGGRDVRIQARPMRRLRHIGTPEQFLDYIESLGGDWFKVDTFARAQYWYVCGEDGSLLVKRTFRFDGMNRNLTDYLRALGIDHFKERNATSRKTFEISNSVRRRLEALYAPDFALFESTN
jgi:Sulfotransferase family